MDPNAALIEVRGLVRDIQNGDASVQDVDRLTELVDGLDEWIRKGGFLPDAWSRDPIERAVANRLD